MGKGKLRKFNDNALFEHVIEPHIKGHIHVDHPLKGNWNNSFFKNNQPLVVEFGCGKGEYTVGMARKFPYKNFIGIDIKGARIWRGAKTSFEEKLTNVAFLRTRIELINSFFAQNEVDEIWITFPDPQMKQRRTKKRLTSSGFLTNYQKLIKDKGIIHLKTDSRFLFEYTSAIVHKNNLEILKSTTDLYSEPWTDEILSIKTHYETLHIDEGNTIFYIAFCLNQTQNLEEPNFEYEHK